MFNWINITIWVQHILKGTFLILCLLLLLQLFLLFVITWHLSGHIGFFVLFLIFSSWSSSTLFLFKLKHETLNILPIFFNKSPLIFNLIIFEFDHLLEFPFSYLHSFLPLPDLFDLLSHTNFHHKYLFPLLIHQMLELFLLIIDTLGPSIFLSLQHLL